MVVYAGTAHLVLPLTDDTELIATYLESLLPSIMPVAGDNPAAALNTAQATLASEPTPGTILFLTDGIDASLAPVFAAHDQASADQVLMLVAGTEAGGPADPELDPETLARADAIAGANFSGLAAIGAAVGASPIGISLDENDLDALIARVRTHLIDTLNQDDQVAWRDAGYPLVWLVAFLMLFWFRKGWTVQWS